MSLLIIAVLIFLVVAVTYYYMHNSSGNNNNNNNNNNNGNNGNSNGNGNGGNQNPGASTKPYAISYLVLAIPYQWGLIAPHMCNLISNVCTLMTAYNQLNIGLGNDATTFTKIGKYSGVTSIIAHVAPGSGNSEAYNNVNNVFTTASAAVTKLTNAFTALNSNINNTYTVANATSVTADDISKTLALYNAFVSLLPNTAELAAYNTATQIENADITKWNPALLSTQDSSVMYNIWLWLYAYYLMMNNTVNLEADENWKYGKGTASSPGSLGVGGWHDMATVATNINADTSAVLTKFTNQCILCTNATNNPPASYTLIDYYNIMISPTYNNASIIDGWITAVINDLSGSGPYAGMNDLLTNVQTA